MMTRPECSINGVSLMSPDVRRQNELFTADALAFLAELHREFGPRIEELDRSVTPQPAHPGAHWQALVEKNLAEPPSTFVCPRRLADDEHLILCDGEPISAGIVDFGLYIHRYAHRLLSEGRTPFMSLLGLESQAESDIWQDLFIHSEQLLGLADGCIRAICMQDGEPVMDEDEDGAASSAAVLMTRTRTGSLSPVPQPVKAAA